MQSARPEVPLGATPPASPPARGGWARLAAFFGGAAVIVALDQLTKALVRARLAEGAAWPPGWTLIRLQHVENGGAAFGIVQGAHGFLVVSSVIAIGAVVAFIFWAPTQSRLYTAAFALILGGAIGNLIDRLRFGSVIDMFYVRFWPVFNVADSAIVCGVVLLMWHLMRTSPKPESASQPTAVSPGSSEKTKSSGNGLN
jgi:signal peptidase II